MTKEEAVNLLRSNVMVACDTSDKVGYGTPLNKAIEDALNMAIKSLEQNTVSEEVYTAEHFARKEAEQKLYELQQNVSDDCVSRQAVLAITGDSCLNLDSYEDTKEFCDEIRNLPCVTPTRKTGHWKRMSDLPIEQDDRWKCSRCGNVIHCKSKMNLRTFFGWDARCGAEMESEDGSN